MVSSTNVTVSSTNTVTTAPETRSEAKIM